MKRKLKVNDFFCGCGGMGIAFKNAGYEIAGAWDFDKYAVESYRANVGDHVQKADIKELHQADIPQADVWAFGFPCQDLSVAGKQRGMILKCEDCGEEIEINPEEYTGNTICPKCSSNNFKAASRSGCFFEMMRLLEETEREREHAMPAVIIAENVRGLRPYLPVLRLEYERHGYTAHIEMFNSKYWNVPQNRDRYAVVGTRNKKNLSFTFPKEQHEFVPKLSDYLEKDVPEKYYLPDEKAQTIIAQAMEKLEKMGKCHACITPDRINKRQNGPRAKAEDEPMFTLTAQDLHGVIILEDEQTEESVVTDIAEETGLLDPNGCGKTLRVGGAEASQRSITTNTLSSIQGGQQTTTDNKCCEHKPVRSWDERKRVLCRGISPNAYNQQGRGDKGNDNRECPFENGIIQAQKNGCGTFVAVAPTLLSSDYKQPPLVIEKRKEQDNGKSQQPGLPNGGDA